MPSFKRKRKHCSDSSNSDTSSDEAEKRRRKKRRKKEKKRKRKKKKAADAAVGPSEVKKKKDRKKKKRKSSNSGSDDETKNSEGACRTSVETDAKRNLMRPMTKEEWEKKQSVVRRVYDESTGRSRLIKGDGEVLEEIVSKSRHQEINRRATAGDGNWFQSKLGLNPK